VQFNAFLDAEGIVMASITIRNLEEDIKQR